MISSNQKILKLSANKIAKKILQTKKKIIFLKNLLNI